VSTAAESIGQAEIWWTELPPSDLPGPAFRRPVVVLQADTFNASAIPTVLCAPLTSSLRLSNAPGTLVLRAEATGLPVDSLANAAQLYSVPKSLFRTRAGRLAGAPFEMLLRAVDLVLGR